MPRSAYQKPRPIHEKSDPAEIAESIYIRRSKSPDRAHVIYGNDHAHFWIDQAKRSLSKNQNQDSNDHNPKPQRLVGLNLSPKQARDVAAEIRKGKGLWEKDKSRFLTLLRPRKGALYKRADAQIDALAKTFEDLADRHKSVLYIYGNQSAREIRATLYHELAHDAEAKFRDIATWFWSMPHSHRIAPVMQAHKYRQRQYVGETIAAILGGQHQELGLSFGESVDVLNYYLANIFITRGEEAVTVFKELHTTPKMRLPLRKAKEKYGPRQGIRDGSEGLYLALPGGEGTSGNGSLRSEYRSNGSGDRSIRESDVGEAGMAGGRQKRAGEVSPGTAREGEDRRRAGGLTEGSQRTERDGRVDPRQAVTKIPTDGHLASAAGKLQALQISMIVGPPPQEPRKISSTGQQANLTHIGINPKVSPHPTQNIGQATKLYMALTDILATGARPIDNKLLIDTIRKADDALSQHERGSKSAVQPLHVNIMLLAHETIKGAKDLITCDQPYSPVNRASNDKGVNAFKGGVHLLTKMDRHGANTTGDSIRAIAKAIHTTLRQTSPTPVQLATHMAAIAGAAISEVNSMRLHVGSHANSAVERYAKIMWNQSERQYHVGIYETGPGNHREEGNRRLWSSDELRSDMYKDRRAGYGASADGRLTTLAGLQQALRRFGIEASIADLAWLASHAKAAIESHGRSQFLTKTVGNGYAEGSMKAPFEISKPVEVPHLATERGASSHLIPMGELRAILPTGRITPAREASGANHQVSDCRER